MGKRIGETSKKAEGQARKAAQAQSKLDAKAREQEAVDKQKWTQGAKSTSKADAAAAKAEEAARKKEEKKALLAAEEASLPSKGGKKPVKKSRGLDLSGLDDPALRAKTINASGIDNALDALSLDAKNDKVDRHPERRFKAAYTQFEERRLEEMKDERGLRRNQKIEQIRKEFDKHPDNPFNQVHAQFNTTGEEMNDIRSQQKAGIERRLTDS